MQDTNSLQDEIRVSQKQVKNLPWSKRLEYYWGYYKYHFIIILLLALLFGNVLHGILTRRETVLSIAYINAFPNIKDDIFIEDFEKYLNLNLKKQEVLLDSGYYISNDATSPQAATYHQKLSTRCMAGLLDVVVADETNFISYGKQGFFTDLRQILSPQQLEYYKDNLLYVEVKAPENLGSVPVGINVTDFPKVTATASYPSSNAYLGIIAGSTNREKAISFLTFLEEQ
ncbi:MAG: hypothetical protein IKW28_09635 [Lachnospiraceae bacterium]|nr:hypothetical protein [Lachnospiraceae bacterium]